MGMVVVAGGGDKAKFGRRFGTQRVEEGIPPSIE